MISNTIKIITRYNEVDQMGYVYHANYINYCHQARTELMRKLGVCDSYLEANDIMMAVISFDVRYKKPVGYDEMLQIKAMVNDMPDVRLCFNFELTNTKDQIVCKAKSTVVFVNAKSRKPIRAPFWLQEIFENAFNLTTV